MTPRIPPTQPNTCGIIVTLNPDAGVSERILQVSAQLHGLVVVDNKSDPISLEPLTRLASDSVIHLISNDDNLGVARALNQGVGWAREHGYEWVFTLDQDTVVFEGALGTLIQAYQDCEDQAKPAVIGSNYIDRAFGVRFFAGDGGGHLWTDVLTVITSGSLISIDSYLDIGPFRDEFFIDHVDDEFCLRARSRGYRVVLSVEPVIEHAVGTPRLHSLLWKRVVTTHAGATRRYYMVRNHLVLIREYRRTEPDWVRWSINVRLKEIILMVCLEEHKLDKIGKVLRGASDAVRGRMGRID